MHIPKNLSFLCILLLSAEVVRPQNDTLTIENGTTETAAEANENEVTSITTAETADTAASDESTTKYFSAVDVPKCEQNDKKLSECVRRIFQIIIPRFVNGNKMLNIPVLDPFILNRTTFQYTNGGITGRITLQNATVYGFREVQQKSVNFKIENGKTKAHVISLVPKLNVVGNYMAEMAINNIHLRPRGRFNVNLVKMKLDQRSEGEFYEKDNHTFVKIVKYQVDPTIEDFKINATGIFPDPALNEIMLNLFNQYWREIYPIVLPETRRFWYPPLLRITNQVLSLVPFDNFVKLNTV